MGPIKAPRGCALNKQKHLIDPGVEVEIMWAWDEILNKHKNMHGSQLTREVERGKKKLTTLVLIEVVPVVLMANLKARITAKHKNQH